MTKIDITRLDRANANSHRRAVHSTPHHHHILTHSETIAAPSIGLGTQIMGKEFRLRMLNCLRLIDLATTSSRERVVVIE
jgi:hypothetical protein